MSLRPLAVIRVVDLADEKGELAGRLLADFGADVVRVEPPAGARSRRLPPFHGGTSLYFAHRNANKRGVVLDLESEPDRARLRELCARADVLIESFAPGTLAGLGLAPADLVERHPQLVAVDRLAAVGLRAAMPRENAVALGALGSRRVFVRLVGHWTWSP